MVHRIRFFTFFIIIIFLVIEGCGTKKDQLSELVEKGKYVDAKALLNQLSPKEMSDSQTRFLIAKINSGLISDSALLMSNNKEYSSAVTLISNRLDDFTSYPEILSSLRKQMLDIAFKGATFFYQKEDYIAAYICFEPTGDITDLISPKQSEFLDLLTKAMLSGVWEGQSEKHKLHITMRLNALTSSTFTGSVLFKETYILCELQNGFFNGEELSATYPINITRYRQTSQGIKGRFDHGDLVMTFPIVVTESKETDYGGGQYGTSYYSHIVQETCIMKKKPK
jgi:hypothetical protein